MTKTKIFSLALVLFALAAIAFVTPLSLSQNESETTLDVKLTGDDVTAMTDIVKDGKCDYTLLFASADSDQGDNDAAFELASLLFNLGAKNVFARPDVTQSESAHEILLGVTNRAISEELYEAVKKESSEGSLVWAIAEKDGKLAFVANSDAAYLRGQEELFAFATDTAFSVPTGYFNLTVLTREYLEAEKEAERQAAIDDLKNKIDSFKYSDFGDAPTTSMTNSAYGKPSLYPKKGEHPRVNVTSYMLPAIREYMEKDEAKYTVKQFWAMANAEYDGILPAASEHTSGRVGFHNMDENGLGIIEAKAFAYLLTGDELYAYQAIYAMKNFLVTIDIQHIYSDQCREFGRIMYCTAEVYDWCYDLLTEEDKAQFIMACADIGSSKNQNTDFGNQMEVGFPPRLQGCVSGHGSEHQVLRDYLSIAIAVFDEDPTWYEWVGGLVYNYYVPFRDYYFVSGTYPQGTNTYAPHRFDADLWSAWLLLSATGEIPYSADFARVTRSFFQNETPNGTLFGTGDGSRKGNASAFWHHAAISSALYGDKPLRAEVMYFTKDLTKYTANTMSFSYAQMLILSGSYFDKVEDATAVDRFSESEPVCYFGSPLGQMTVRSQWNDPNAAATLMKLGERSTANHEHADAGTFQIFYKGLYTGDAGMYDKYGSTHWTYYHTQTVAHNGLLIQDPERIGNDPSVVSSYFYSGGQRKLSEASNLEVWKSSTYDTGTVLGAQWAYNDDGTTDYAYLGGDITAAYDPSVVSYVGRRMLTYYTGNPDAPMYLIVYDDLHSIKDNAKKTFLLHTVKEPTINEITGTVETIDNDGRLVLQPLLGGDSVTSIGGKGMCYAINGRQCATVSGAENSAWGRVEVSTTSTALKHNMLNFMYVTDATSDLILTPELISADYMNGLVIDDLVVIFAESEIENNMNQLTFSVEGTGLYRYLVLGMFEGTWNISVDGMSVAHAVSSNEGGMITFYAPAGDVVVSPGKDIAPANGGRIIYNAFGGIVPDDAPLVYEIGVPVPLPTNIENGSDRFVGWFTTPTYEPGTEITEIVATEKGKFAVYAKYNGVAFEEDYETNSINSNKITVNGVSYNGKDGSAFVTVKDDITNNTYLHITKGTLDPQIDVAKQPKTYLYGETKITLVIDLARDSSTPLNSTCRARGQNGSSDTVPFFSTSTSGSIFLGGKTAIMTLTEIFQTLAVTMDFEAGTITGYDATGNVLATVDFTAPAASQISTSLEWMSSLSTSVNWWIGSGETLLIDNFSVYAGDYVPKPIVLPEGYSPITYNTNGGSFVSSTAKMYKEGEVTLLEPNIIKGSDTFLGWYTTPDFESGTKIAEIGADARGEIVVYAKWAGIVISESFEDVEVDLKELSAPVGALESGATGKAGSIYKTEKDTDGNTYLYWHRGTSDSQLKYWGTLGQNFSGKHVATFTVRLATVEGETPMAFQYRVRSTAAVTPDNTANSITIFATDTSGNVKLAGNGTTFATLSSDKFTTIIVSMDFDNNLLIAYSESGSELATAPFELADYKSWIDAMNLPMYLYPSGGQSLKFDDFTISTSTYSSPDEDLPTSVGKIDYITNGGTLGSDAPRYYNKGEVVQLPVPVKPGSVFLGWYKDADYTTRIESITESDTDNFILYAAWQTVMLDFKAEDHDTSYDMPEDKEVGSVNAAGLTMQTKGEDSFYRTLEDDAGNTYLLWSKGAGDPQINFGGNLNDKASGSKVITFSITVAKDNGSFTPINVRMRTGILADGKRREVSLLRITSGGDVILGFDTAAVIGKISDEFKTFGVVANFNTGKIYGYNELGDLAVEADMYLPADYTTYDDLYDAITGDIMGIYAGGSQKTTMRIKALKVETGNSYT